MKTVNLIGHLLVDRIYSQESVTETLGGIANVWSSLLRLNNNINVNVSPCSIGEALIVVNKNINRRVGKAILNHNIVKPTISTSDWYHIAYLNQIDNLSFLDSIHNIVSADITKEKPELCYNHLNKIDYLFISKEDLFEDIKIIGKKVNRWVIAHDPFGSIYSDGSTVHEHILPDENYLNNVNILGAGDSFAACFINEHITNSDMGIHNLIKNAHLNTTNLIKNK